MRERENNATTAPALLSSEMVAERLCVSIRTLWRLVERGVFPQPIRFNRKLLRLTTAALNAWLVERGGAPWR